MYIFKYRPLLFGCTVSVLALLVSFHCEDYVSPILLLSILFAAVTVCAVGAKRDLCFFDTQSKLLYLIVCIMAFLLVLSSFSYKSLYLGKTEEHYTVGRQKVTLYGYSIGEGDAVMYGFDNTSMPYKVKLYLYEPSDIEAYREFKYIGSFERCGDDNSVNSAYYTANNICAICIGNIEYTGREIYSVSRLFYTVRQYSFDCIEKYCTEQADTVAALVLGMRDKLPSSLYNDFCTTGTSHLAAVSGLHLIAVLAAVDFLLKKLVPIKSLNSAVITVVCFIYMFISGGQMSVMRAGAMFFICRISASARIRYDSLTSLAAATYFGFLICPYAIYDVGFILSVLSTLGLLVFGVPGAKMYEGYINSHPFPDIYTPTLKRVGGSLIYSVSCMAFIIPVLYVYFRTFCPLAPISTVLLSFPIMAVLYTAPLCILFSFNEPLASFCGKITEACCELCVYGADFCAENFSMFASLKMPFTPVLFGVCAFFVLILLIKKRTRTDFVIMFTCLSLVFTACYFIYPITSDIGSDITVYSEGDGEILCIVSDGDALICDSTDGDSYSAFADMCDMLAYRGVTRADYIVTGLSYAHISYLDTVSRNILIDTLYINTPDVYTQEYTERIKQLAADGDFICSVFSDKVSCRIDVGDTYLTLLPSVSDGVGNKRVPYIIGDCEYAYCPAPIHRISTYISPMLTEECAVIYGTVTYPESYTLYPIHRARVAYIPQSLTRSGFSVDKSMTEVVNHCQDRFKISLDDK